jgi:hypothetical protein
MKIRRALAAAGFFGVAALAEVLAQAPPQFRATVTGISVPVTVRSRGDAVQGLTAKDFVLTDSGVPQDIVAVDAATLPLDLTVVAQETIRTGGYGSGTFEEEIAAVAASSRQGDRLTVRFVGRDQRALTPPLPPIRIDVASLEYACIPVYDTLARALMEPTVPDRQRVVVLIAVGEGKGGYLSMPRVREIAQRANVRLYVVSVEPNNAPKNRKAVAYSMCPELSVDWSHDRKDRLRHLDRMQKPFDQWHQLWADSKNRLVEIAELTGGREVRPTILTQGTTGPLREVFDEIRGSYVLRYTPKGVLETGWHPITVKVTRDGGYDLRVRPGYQR